MSGWTLSGIGAAAAIAVVAFLLTCLVAVWLESRWVTFQGNYHQPDPETFVFTQTPETEAGLAYEEVSFPTAGGATLRGWLVPAAAPTDLAIVAFHGAGGDRRSNMGHLRMLHELGATVLLFDAREHGLSDGNGRGLGLAVREGEDGVAAVDEMRRRGFGTVIGYGCSLGGSSAIVAAAADDRIDGIIVEASLASFEQYVADKADRRLGKLGIKVPAITRIWGDAVIGVTRWRLGLTNYVRPQDVIGKIAPRPILLIHGGQDMWVIEDHARSLVAGSDQKADYWPIEDAGHCDGYQVAGEEYRTRVAGFLARFQAAE